MSAIKYHHFMQSVIAEELELIDDDLRSSMRETEPEEWNLLYVDYQPNSTSENQRSLGST